VKVFISWSGNRSEAVAKALKNLIESVLPDVEGWLSSENLTPGTLWTPALLSQIARASYGILCLTSENVDRPWILFEAGGLSASIQGRSVCPYLLDLSPPNLKQPLSLLNTVAANKDGTFALLRAINRQRKGATPFSDGYLRGIFCKFWPIFDRELNRARKMAPNIVPLQELKNKAIEDIVRKLVEMLSMTQIAAARGFSKSQSHVRLASSRTGDRKRRRCDRTSPGNRTKH